MLYPKENKKVVIQGKKYGKALKLVPYLDILLFQNSSDWNGIFVILDTATIYTEIFPANKVSRSRHKKGIRV